MILVASTIRLGLSYCHQVVIDDLSQESIPKATSWACAEMVVGYTELIKC